MSNPNLIILDRDGVINLDSDDYIKSVEEWIPIRSSLKAIARLNQAGYKVAIATNQSGIARGYFDLSTLDLIHKKMLYEIENGGGHIEKIEFCSDHPKNPTLFRKPNPGMLLKLCASLGVNQKDTWFVGDSLSDLNCAINASCKPALVLTGKGKTTVENNVISENIPVFDDLNQFVNFILDSSD